MTIYTVSSAAFSIGVVLLIACILTTALGNRKASSFFGNSAVYMIALSAFMAVIGGGL